MNLKSITYYVSFAGIVFALSFAYLQSLQLGFEKDNMILTIKGENVQGIKTTFNNRFAMDIELDTIGLKTHSNNKISFNIPDYAYIRRLQMTLENDSGFKLNKVIFTGINNNVTIKNKDIGHFFHVSKHTYDPKRSTYVKLNDSITYNKFIIYSSDLSDLLKSSYIKRILPQWIIILSILTSAVSLLIYYFITARKKIIKIWKYLAGIMMALLGLFAVQIIFFSDKINEINLDDSNTINYFKLDLTGNLVYNGDFRHGLFFWGAMADSTTLELINTPFGKGVKVTRGDGNGGYWSLRYIGRPILYHKDHTYQIKFKYKIIKGEGIPFNIGWWVKVNGRALGYRLKLLSTPLHDGWFDAEVQYTFQEEFRNPATFLNSLKDYAEVCITDVQIFDLNREVNQKDFLDQEDEDFYTSAGQ